MKNPALFLLLLVLFPILAAGIHHGGSHRGVHHMPKASRDYHRVINEEHEQHPHIKHYFDWRNKVDSEGPAAKAFRGKVPDDLIHYLVQERKPVEL
mmetsp:Transcript_38322/g.108353  ORF Transcript_38322/g.108353 Transcript_38322/m.108353 type:complete len:96 (-) Transcript_38322:175-462(-)